MQAIRETPLEISKEEFQKIGYKLIDLIAEFVDNIREVPVTTGESPTQIKKLIGDNDFPEAGTSVTELFSKASGLLLKHSLFNGHPKFLGYITGSPAPIGALADMLAAIVNANMGANILSPMATAIEQQTIKWLASFIGVPTTYGGLMVSGGNMANFTAFLAARTAKLKSNIKEDGLKNAGDVVFYCSDATHTWIDKAAVLFGHGTRSIRWIKTGSDNKMNVDLLQDTIHADLEAGKTPFMVIGNAGAVGTGAVDDLSAIAIVCKNHNLWFHVDGAYGIPAAIVPELSYMFEGIRSADSIALDPHKWLYCPLEAGCVLVKDPQHLLDTYSSHPVYYNFGNSENEPVVNYYEYGFQNSRSFKALKVWMVLQQIGRKGYVQLIKDDIALSELFYSLAQQHNELEAVSRNLSITTLRYVPLKYSDASLNESDANYLNELNRLLLDELQQSGEMFLSNAVVGDKYCLRGCIVNFRTTEKDIYEMIEIIVREGRKMHIKLQAGQQQVPAP
jgi:aromatic-L-amino-acid/L-tryptophan decarboxylase